MANPSTLVGSHCGILVSSTTEGSVTLDPHREYTFVHLAVDNTGASAADAIYLGTATITATPAEGNTKFELRVGGDVVLGPGISTLYIKLAAGAATAPTFAWSASGSFGGRF